MSIGNNVDTFYYALEIMGLGMAGIFLVLIIIFLAIKALLKVFPEKEGTR